MASPGILWTTVQCPEENWWRVVLSAEILDVATSVGRPDPRDREAPLRQRRAAVIAHRGAPAALVDAAQGLVWVGASGQMLAPMAEQSSAQGTTMRVGSPHRGGSTVRVAMDYRFWWRPELLLVRVSRTVSSMRRDVVGPDLSAAPTVLREWSETQRRFRIVAPGVDLALDLRRLVPGRELEGRDLDALGRTGCIDVRCVSLAGVVEVQLPAPGAEVHAVREGQFLAFSQDDARSWWSPDGLRWRPLRGTPALTGPVRCEADWCSDGRSTLVFGVP